MNAFGHRARFLHNRSNIADILFNAVADARVDEDVSCRPAPICADLRARQHEASSTFRKLRGYSGMPILVRALRDHDQLIKPAFVDASKKAA